MTGDFISIESVLFHIKKGGGVPFEITYYSIRSKCRKTKRFLYRNVADIATEGTISLTDMATNGLATIKISHIIKFNQNPVKH